MDNDESTSAGMRPADAAGATVTTPGFRLFQRDDCHLCDLALAVLAEARLPAFESVFIDEDAALEAAYGTRVPVLRDDARGVELEWPFDAEAVRALIEVAGAAGRASAT